jgi:acyl-coenzyme A thioesterase PaaI-like protein
VQGGALAGLAIAVARAAAERPSARVLSAHVAFLSPASPGVVAAEARVDRAGRRAAFVRVELGQGAEIVSTATVVLGGAS